MFEILHDHCKPTKGTKYSAGIDLCLAEDVSLCPGDTVMVGLGVKINMQGLASIVFNDDTRIEDWARYLGGPAAYQREHEFDKFLSSHYLKLSIRSSIAKQGYRIANSEGIIDLDYPGEIKMLLEKPITSDDLIENRDDTRCQIDSCTETIKKGVQIAQVTLIPHCNNLLGVESSKSRIGGFGSTNV